MFVVVTYSKMGRLWNFYIYIYIWRYYINAGVTFFLKVGVHWTLPRDCTVGTSLGGTTRGIFEGFPGPVLSKMLRYYSYLVPIR